MKLAELLQRLLGLAGQAAKVDKEIKHRLAAKPPGVVATASTTVFPQTMIVAEFDGVSIAANAGRVIKR